MPPGCVGNRGEEVADRIIFLSGGTVAEEGLAHHVLTRPQHPLTARFLQVMGAERASERAPGLPVS